MAVEPYASVHEGKSSERNVMAWVGFIGALGSPPASSSGSCPWARMSRLGPARAR